MRLRRSLTRCGRWFPKMKMRYLASKSVALVTAGLSLPLFLTWGIRTLRIGPGHSFLLAYMGLLLSVGTVPIMVLVEMGLIARLVKKIRDDRTLMSLLVWHGVALGIAVAGLGFYAVARSMPVATR